jgi:adenylate kinase family enzyme
MDRVVVIGAAGSGKSTLAERLGARLDCPYIDLDALFWGPNWVSAPPDVFRASVDAALAGPRWTISGNYRAVRDLTWMRADTLIWLDYPLWFTYGRLLRRTTRRVMTGEALWAGNRETWRNAFFSRDSLLWYILKTHASQRQRFEQELAAPEYYHLQSLRFRLPGDAERWYASLPGAAGGSRMA